MNKIQYFCLAQRFYLTKFAKQLILLTVAAVILQLTFFAAGIFTARCYASAVLAMGLCPSVCVCHKPVFY